MRNNTHVLFCCGQTHGSQEAVFEVAPQGDVQARPFPTLELATALWTIFFISIVSANNAKQGHSTTPETKQGTT